jgi:MYXO-CTERM domain-containing protein
MFGRAPSRLALFIAAAAASSSVTLAATSAAAHGPYVVVRDDGSLTHPITNPDVNRQAIMKQYKASGAPVPDILSVWTTFPMGGEVFETLFDPVANDVQGIGLEQDYGGDGTFTSDTPPLRSMLLHNDVLALAQRAKTQYAPTDGFADYLFLLELSHNWGPEVRIPSAADGGGGPSTELEGFPFHWSFWNDMGGSPAGGNPWKDNGDGTFTAQSQNPGAMTYSMLDLYLMGLADASEVKPFGALENAVPPKGVLDPFTGQPYAASSFPWFGTTPFTVTATRRTLTIDDVVATNGKRVPAFGASPTSWTLGIVLVVGATESDAQISQAEATFDPIAAGFAPAFSRATGGRGTMHVVTQLAPDADAGADAGVDGDTDDAGDDASTPDASASAPHASSGSGGCSTGGSPADGALFGVAAALLVALRRRARSASAWWCGD